jgi:16S rRNA (uracil1498-N3)-methyltransferase
MTLPFFYIENIDHNNSTVVLDEDTSKHVVSVLRMKLGEKLHLTDGKGHLLTAEIINDHKKRCETRIVDTRFTPVHSRKISIAISLIKNATRFEWFLEKATEIGITEIIPLICERTERQQVRQERMKNVLISSMLQSRQTWLPILQEPVAFNKVVERSGQGQRLIAHCANENKTRLWAVVDKNIVSPIILIGPEGDFTKEEIDYALAHQFNAVALGDTRLRTETAGVVAATLLKMLDS